TIALENIDAVGSVERAAFLIDLSNLYYFDQRVNEVIALESRLRAAVAEANRPDLTIELHFVLAMSFVSLGRAEAGQREFAAGVALAREERNYRLLTMMIYNESGLASLLCDHARVFEIVDEAAAIVEAHGIRRFAVVTEIIRAAELSVIGDL